MTDKKKMKLITLGTAIISLIGFLYKMGLINQYITQMLGNSIAE